MNSGSYWRGRPLHWNPDQQMIEQERQRWVSENLGRLNDAVVELTVDPDTEYRIHRDAYVQTGDPVQLRRALDYVRA